MPEDAEESGRGEKHRSKRNGATTYEFDHFCLLLEKQVNKILL